MNWNTRLLYRAALTIAVLPNLVLPLFAQQPMALDVVLPNGRHITPAGDWIPVSPYPYAIALRPVPSGAGETEATIPAVGWPFALNITSLSSSGEHRAVLRRLPSGPKSDPDIETHAGLAYSPDGLLLYVATGDSGAVHIYDTRTWKRVAKVRLDGEDAQHSFAATLVLSRDGHWLYVLDQGNWRVVVIDTVARQRVGSVPTGVNPMAIALSPDQNRLYVTNSGLFEYKSLKGVRKQDVLHTGLPFPAFGYPSAEARGGVDRDGQSVPGLGDENDARGSSLWTYRVSTTQKLTVESRLRLGRPIGQNHRVGGASPTGIVTSADRVYCTLAHDDAVAVISSDGKKLIRRIQLSPFDSSKFHDDRGEPLRGVMPAGMALHGSQLYVTEAGINAVAVIDTATDVVLGHLPVGWYPTAATISPDGEKLFVVNTKGKGSGPNAGAGFDRTASGSYVGELEFGSVSAIPLQISVRQLTTATAQVVRNNQAVPQLPGPLPRLKHVFLIVRENRTFDEILGDLPGADGDPALARWGMHGWLESAPHDHSLAITPNAHALASRFATSDRFFMDSDVSADGHRWAVGAAPTPWFHIAWTTNYGGRRTSDPFSASPGRRAMSGGADAPMPEDEPEFGTLWEHVADAGLAIRNYGESLEIEGGDEIDGSAPSGQRIVLNAPLPAPVFANSDRSFPTFNLGIPDQYRYEELARDLGPLLKSDTVPSLVVIRLPGDHTATPRPKDGYPDRGSYVADNDLALGRIIDLLSHSAAWKDSAVFVTEDDSQGGVDHVDAHRSVLLVISPWVRRGTISHRHTSMTSIQRTAYELLGLGPLNLEDALAADLSDVFSPEPDLTPYTAVAPDLRIFDPAQARIAQPANATEARELLDCDDAPAIAAEMHRAGKQSRAGREARKMIGSE